MTALNVVDLIISAAVTIVSRQHHHLLVQIFELPANLHILTVPHVVFAVIALALGSVDYFDHAALQ